jgi:hypothetical protein
VSAGWLVVAILAVPAIAVGWGLGTGLRALSGAFRREADERDRQQPNVISRDADGRYSDETDEQWARRSTTVCGTCGLTGHLACIDRLGPGESATFGPGPIREENPS